MRWDFNKLYQNLKWILLVGKVVVDFVYNYLVYRQIKAKHQKLAVLFQRIDTPEWKLERITMDLWQDYLEAQMVMTQLVNCKSVHKSSHFLHVEPN